MDTVMPPLPSIDFSRRYFIRPSYRRPPLHGRYHEASMPQRRHTSVAGLPRPWDISKNHCENSDNAWRAWPPGAATIMRGLTENRSVFVPRRRRNPPERRQKLGYEAKRAHSSAGRPKMGPSHGASRLTPQYPAVTRGDPSSRLLPG